jgi:hypothetical protein
MKQVLLLIVFSMFTYNFASAISYRSGEQPDYVIIEDAVMFITANHYLSALSVTVSILDVNNQVLAVVQTSAGQTVTRNATGNERKALFVYNMGSGQTNYIIDDVVH